MFVTEQYYSYQKVENLNGQKKTLIKLFNKQKQPADVDIIKYNSTIALLHSKTNKLLNRIQYNYLTSLILKNTKESTEDLYKLNKLINKLDKNIRENIELNSNDINFKNSQIKLKKTYISTLIFIDSIILKNVSYDSKIFNIFFKLFILIIGVVLFITFWYKIRLNNIYKDILLLSSANSRKKDINIFSQEVETILSKTTKKTQVSNNPTMIDPITEINNNKGMAQAYLESKSSKGNSFSSVTILEIDNFSKSKRVFSQEFTQEILKKVAYTISLHEQITDIIARTDYNQFTLIFSRNSKEQLFKDVDLVRQSISEIKLTTQEEKTIKITVTGGFIIKTNNSSLEDSIRKAKKLLEDAKYINEANKVFQIKDLPQ